MKYFQLKRPPLDTQPKKYAFLFDSTILLHIVTLVVHHTPTGVPVHLIAPVLELRPLHAY